MWWRGEEQADYCTVCCPSKQARRSWPAVILVQVSCSKWLFNIRNPGVTPDTLRECDWAAGWPFSRASRFLILEGSGDTSFPCIECLWCLFRLGNVMSTQQMKTGNKSASLEQSLKIKGELCSLCLNTFPCLSSLGHCLNPKSTVHCDFF